jgi:hypothetical protein
MILGSGKEFEFEIPRQRNLIPDNIRDRFILLAQLEEALKASWGADTCSSAYAHLWKYESPAFGQCAVTAIVIQDFVGGKIVKDPAHDHYWNLMDDGTEVDLARMQFNVSVTLQAKENRTREYMLTHERSVKARTPERYLILLNRVRKHLASN